ncbi:MAG: NAD(P)-dependent alcohol dehydrogenase [Devosia sp.]
MRALVYERYGPPDQVLRLADVPRPEPGADEVLVRVHAASVNSWDWDQLTGTPLGRVLGPFKPRHKVLGADIAGVVEAVGEGVTAFRPGDPVFGDLSEGKWGGFAEYAVAKTGELARMPDGLGFIDAAAIPQAGALALQGLRKRTALGATSSVLLNGAGGGVGTFALQLAKAMQAHVTVVDRGEKREALLALGADRFIDYREADFTADGQQYDLVVDVVARHSPGRFAASLKDGGELVVIGGRIPTLLQVAALGGFVGRGRRQRLGLLIYKPSPADNLELAQRCAAGTLRPIIDGVYPLSRGAEALARIGSGLAVGKVMISVAE